MNMIKNKSNKKKHNEGSAMLIAIVVSIVVVVFCLSLLLVSYSLFTSTSRKVSQTQCRELAKTVSIEIEKELAAPNYSSYADEKLACESGDNPLWFYVRYNVCQDSWPYFEDQDVTGHNSKAAYRYFNLSTTGGDVEQYKNMADDISVCMFWISEGNYYEEKEDTLLCVQVTVTKHEQKAMVSSYYVLGCGPYTEDDVTDVEPASGSNMEAINPNGNIIDIEEHWSWSLQERR